MFALNILAQSDAGGAGALIVSAVFSLIALAILIVMIASMWKLFEKAGQPGWAALIPFYNIFIMLQIIERPTWWLLLFLIPGINGLVGILLSIELAKSFGKELQFAIGFVLVPVIFMPMLAFSDARYQGASPLF